VTVEPVKVLDPKVGQTTKGTDGETKFALKPDFKWKKKGDKITKLRRDRFPVRPDHTFAAIGDAIAVRTGEKQRIGEIDAAQVLQGLFDLSAQLFA